MLRMRWLRRACFGLVRRSSTCQVFDEDRLYKRSLEIQPSARKDTSQATNEGKEDDIEQTKLIRIVHRVVACQDFKALKVPAT